MADVRYRQGTKISLSDAHVIAAFVGILVFGDMFVVLSNWVHQSSP